MRKLFTLVYSEENVHLRWTPQISFSINDNRISKFQNAYFCHIYIRENAVLNDMTPEQKKNTVHFMNLLLNALPYKISFSR